MNNKLAMILLGILLLLFNTHLSHSQTVHNTDDPFCLKLELSSQDTSATNLTII